VYVRGKMFIASNTTEYVSKLRHTPLPTVYDVMKSSKTISNDLIFSGLILFFAIGFFWV